MNQGLWDIYEVAYYLNMSPSFVKGLVRKRKIVPCKIGRKNRYLQRDVDAYVESRRVDSPEKARQMTDGRRRENKQGVKPRCRKS